MNCQFYTPRTKDGGRCSNGLGGGLPSHGFCEKCIMAGENTEEFAKALFAREKTSFPESARKNVRPCC
jgi:hypothetical protein